MEDRVRLRLVDILNHHNPPELSQEVLDKIYATLAEEEIRAGNVK
jgi:hypothetical protein